MTTPTDQRRSHEARCYLNDDQLSRLDAAVEARGIRSRSTGLLQALELWTSVGCDELGHVPVELLVYQNPDGNHPKQSGPREWVCRACFPDTGAVVTARNEDRAAEALAAKKPSSTRVAS